MALRNAFDILLRRLGSSGDEVSAHGFRVTASNLIRTKARVSAFRAEQAFAGTNLSIWFDELSRINLEEEIIIQCELGYALIVLITEGQPDGPVRELDNAAE